MKRFHPHIILPLTVLFLAGCASQKLDFDDLEPSPEVLNNQISTVWNRVERIEASLALHVQNSKFNGSLFGTLHLGLPDRLSLILKAPFGIKIGELIVSDGYYEAVFATGQFEYGAVEDFDLAAMTGIPLPSGDLLRLFEPITRPIIEGFVQDSTLAFALTAPDSLWQWRVAEGSLDHQILYNPEEGHVVEERWFDNAGDDLALFKQYLETSWTDDVPLAYELQLESGGAFPTKVRVQFKTLELNPIWKTDPFQLKANSN